MIFELLILFLASSITSFLLVLWVKRLFYKFNILDNPKKYGLKRAPIPYATWVVFIIGFFLMSFLFVDYNYKLWLIWFFGFLITAISFIDDRLNVSAKVRLIIQIIIGAVIWLTSIKIWYVSNIFGWIINLETYHIDIFQYTIYIIPLLFTILWYVFVFNALNWSDGIQGNTSGISVISFFILFVLGLILFHRDTYEGWIVNAIFIAKTSLILVWIILPFWYFDFQEKILMWDSGTMFLGFMLATLAIIAGWKIATVLVVFGIYAVDAVYVIIKRLLKKKNPLSGDFTHLHHRLLKLWLEKKQVLYLIYSLSFFFGLTALLLDKTGKIIVFIIICIIVIFINNLVELTLKWRKRFIHK